MLFEKIIPTVSEGGFSFFSGDKNVTEDKVYPTTLSLALKPGDDFSGTLVIKNRDQDKKKFRLNIDEFKLDTGTATDTDTDSKDKEELVLPGMKFTGKKSLIIGPGELGITYYTIHIPENIKEGKYKTVASAVFDKSEAYKDQKTGGVVNLFPAVGVKVKIDVSKNPNYFKYEPLISKEPFAIAKSVVITEARIIFAVILGALSLFFLYKHFKKNPN
jgi:hypothetical protein